MAHFKTNIVLIPKVTGSEKAIGVVIVVFMFIPFAIGIFSESKWLLLSLPAGFALLFIFNWASNGKFNHKNWVQKDFFVEFTPECVKIISSAGQKEVLWKEMEGTQLQVLGFDGEVKPGEDESGHYNGTENKLTFYAQGIKYEFNYYLKNGEQKQELKLLLQNVTAPRTHLTFQEQQAIYSADINSFKEIPKEPEPTGRRKSIKSIGCLVLFITPFVLIGVGTLGLTIYQFGKVVQARDWASVQAKVLSVEMISSSDSESTSNKVEMKYEYSLGAQTVIGSSVSFNSGMNNIEHHGDLYSVLNHSHIIQVYVNKSDPTESVVIRGVTNAMIGILIFSILWNSLLLAFLLPAVNKKVQMKKVFVVTMVIWALGIGKFIFRAGDIDISKQVVVIEAKKEHN